MTQLNMSPCQYMNIFGDGSFILLFFFLGSQFSFERAPLSSELPGPFEPATPVLHPPDWPAVDSGRHYIAASQSTSQIHWLSENA